MIPEGWKPYDFGELASKIEGGGTPSRKSPEYWNGSIPWATVKDLTATKLCGTEEGISEAGLANSSSKLIPSGTMIIATRMALGKAVVFDRDVSINQDLKAVYPKSNVEPSFLHHWYISRASYIEALGTGSTVKGIRLDDLKFLAVQLPPLPEQKKIAAILTSVDEAIEKQEAQIAKLQDLKKALMQELLTQGIGHTEFKDSPVGKIPKGWEVVQLRDIGTFSKGKGIAKNEVVDVGIPCIRYAEIYTDYDFVIRKFVSFTTLESAQKSKRIKAGDILFAGSGETVEDIGKSVAFIGEHDAYVGGDAVIFSPSVEVFSVFLSYQLNDDIRRIQLRKLGQGSSVIHIYSSGLEQVFLVLPGLDEQQRIVSMLTSIDDNIEAKQKKLAHTMSLKKALMQDLLTGKVRVSVTPAQAGVQ